MAYASYYAIDFDSRYKSNINNTDYDTFKIG